MKFLSINSEPLKGYTKEEFEAYGIKLSQISKEYSLTNRIGIDYQSVQKKLSKRNSQTANEFDTDEMY